MFVFITITVITYFIHLEYHTDFKIGFPKVFYYQFLIDCSIQHGSDTGNMIADYAFTWIATWFAWVLSKQAYKKIFANA